MVEPFFPSCFFEDFSNQLRVVLVFVGVFQRRFHFFVADKFLRLHRFGIVHICLLCLRVGKSLPVGIIFRQFLPDCLPCKSQERDRFSSCAPQAPPSPPRTLRPCSACCRKCCIFPTGCGRKIGHNHVCAGKDTSFASAGCGSAQRGCGGQQDFGTQQSAQRKHF